VRTWWLEERAGHPLKSYQQADHATMRQALATRQRTVRAKPA
jgi:hypothetical protein